jgi:hypothetical protein
MEDHARKCEGRNYTCTCGYDAESELLRRRSGVYEEILRTVCHHLELPQSEGGPADDLRLYDQALEAADLYTKKADADLAENKSRRFKAEAEAYRLQEALKTVLAALAATTSVLSRAQQESCKPSKAVASDAMFALMLKDYEAAAAKGRAALKEASNA